MAGNKANGKLWYIVRLPSDCCFSVKEKQHTRSWKILEMPLEEVLET